MPEHILLCNFDFPPNQGIGGRRWAKFAKGLANEGFIVHVIKSKPAPNSEMSPWTQDVLHENIILHELPRTYPPVISHTGKGWLAKIRYRLAVRRLRRQESGTIYDVAIGWESLFRKSAQRLIRNHSIRNVIATGAPWNLLVYAARLKDLHPHLRLIIDYRDPWITARNYGMPQLEPSRKNVELAKQSLVFSKADVITCPNNALLEEIRSSVLPPPSVFPEMKVLSHCFDEDDYHPIRPIERSNGKIVFVYGGALYVEMDQHLEKFRSYLRHLRQENFQLFQLLEFRIFTDNLIEAEAFREFENVVISPPVGKQILSEILAADFCLMFLSHHNRNFKTTKFFEYLPLRKPFVFVGEEGEISKELEHSHLGRVIRNFEKDFDQLIEDFRAHQLNYNSEYDISADSLRTRTKELIALFK